MSKVLYRQYSRSHHHPGSTIRYGAYRLMRNGGSHKVYTYDIDSLALGTGAPRVSWKRAGFTYIPAAPRD